MDRGHAILQSFQSLSISSTNIDFGPEFASNRTPEEFVTIVDQYLKQHHQTCDKLHRFSLYFCPFDMFLRHIEHWVEYAVSKRVDELELDFSMGSTPYTGELPDGAHPFRLPNCVFSCKSLTGLSLSHFEIFPPQYLTGFTGFGCLCSLSLSYVNIRDDTLQWVLASCCFLQSLSLKYCSSLDSIKISAQGLQLQKLVIVDCRNALEIVVHAPNLQTLIYSGEHAFSEKAINVPSLVDAFVSSICAEHSEPEHDYIRLISDLAHVKTLTVCTATLWRVEIYKEIDAEMLPILLHNLKELQLLMDFMCIEDLACIYSFFRLCPSPFIEKLFIQELSQLKEALNTELEQLTSDFQELRTTLKQQQEDVSTSLRNLGLGKCKLHPPLSRSRWDLKSYMKHLLYFYVIYNKAFVHYFLCEDKTKTTSLF